MKKVLFAGAALFTAAIVSATAFEGGLNHEGHEGSKNTKEDHSFVNFDPSRSSWFNVQAGAVPTQAKPAVGAGLQAGPPQSVADFQPMVAKYCFGCHNTKNPLPAGLPLALDKANFADPGAD